jgi:rubrerythrin
VIFRNFSIGSVALALAATVLLAGCGSGGGVTTTDEEKAADAETLNLAIGRELTTIDAYDAGLPLLPARLAAIGRQLRGQAQEHVDALTKAMRGLGGEVEAEKGELDLSEVKNGADFLTLAYELESAALGAYTDAAARLATSAPRRLAAALAASTAQHLVVLRQSLGSNLLGAFPEAFDSGQVPPPGG